ncbi:MAG TPA: hypothetical protein VGI47_11840 [Candidatus Binataceae bacterium]
MRPAGFIPDLMRDEAPRRGRGFTGLGGRGLIVLGGKQHYLAQVFGEP